MSKPTSEQVPAQTEDCAMMATPQREHDWLQQFIGEWRVEGECIMGPDQPPMTTTGSCVTRSIGGLWIVNEGSGDMPGGGTAHSIITLGYDPQTERFVGTFIASMMTHLWRYDGQLDAAGQVLTLDTEGPSMLSPGAMAKYQDIVTVVDADHWILTSQMPGEDGTWTQFMTAHYRRTK
jgi:hypothetical protein